MKEPDRECEIDESEKLREIKPEKS